VGGGRPMDGQAALPEAWRTSSDKLLNGLKLPPARRNPEKQSAAEYLAGRLGDRGRPIRILALGPLTNLGEALERAPGILRGVELVIMGGAVRVPGNLGDGDAFRTENKAAEWNLFVDPVAARL